MHYAGSHSGGLLWLPAFGVYTMNIAFQYLIWLVIIALFVASVSMATFLVKNWNEPSGTQHKFSVGAFELTLTRR